MKLGLYRHTNGNLYQVLSVARHSETLEEMVVYQALYNDFAVWVRPKRMFEEQITLKGQPVPRFTFLSENLIKAPALRE